MTIALVDFRRDRRELAREDLARLGLHGHRRLHADTQPPGFELGHARFELHFAQVGDDDDRLVAGDRARVVIALDDETVDR